MLPANLAKSRVAGPRGLGELVMVSPHGSGMLQTLRYSPYSVPVSTNTAMVAALSQQPLMANQPPPSPLLHAPVFSPHPPGLIANRTLPCAKFRARPRPAGRGESGPRRHRATLRRGGTQSTDAARVHLRGPRGVGGVR